ncbi:MAG TPA: TIGR03943 family protein [Chloroflexota bacterium]
MTATRFRALIAACPPLLVAVFIGKLWVTGTLGYYVNNRTIWIVIIGGLLFTCVGAVTLWRSTQDAEHDGLRLSWRTLVFLVPVAIGIALPARPLSASSGQSSSLGALQLASHVSSGSPGDTFGYWVSELGGHPDAAWWAGKKVSLVGFVSQGSGLPSRSFILGRYLVTCCVVDATLFGFPVQLLDSQRVPAQGAWIQVSGTFGRRYWTDPSGEQYPLIEHARIVPARIPSSPYLSP